MWVMAKMAYSGELFPDMYKIGISLTLTLNNMTSISLSYADPNTARKVLRCCDYHTLKSLTLTHFSCCHESNRSTLNRKFHLCGITETVGDTSMIKQDVDLPVRRGDFINSASVMILVDLLEVSEKCTIFDLVDLKGLQELQLKCFQEVDSLKPYMERFEQLLAVHGRPARTTISVGNSENMTKVYIKTMNDLVYYFPRIARHQPTIFIPHRSHSRSPPHPPPCYDQAEPATLHPHLQ